MKTHKLKKMTKAEFEQHLFELNKNETLIHRKHNDYNYLEGTNTILHLYYNNPTDYLHIGTWQRGGHCWTFEREDKDEEFIKLQREAIARQSI